MNLVQRIHNDYWKRRFINKQLNKNIILYLYPVIHCDNPIYCNSKKLYHTAAFENNNTVPNNVDKLICEDEGMFKILQQVYDEIAQKNVQNNNIFTDNDIHNIIYTFCQDYDNKGMMGISGIGMDNHPHLIETYIYQLAYTNAYKDIIQSKEITFELKSYQDFFNRWRYIAFIINHDLKDMTYQTHTIQAYVAGSLDSQLDIDLVNNMMWAETINFKQIDDYTTKY